MHTSLTELVAFGLTGSHWLAVVLTFVVIAQLTILSVTLYLHRCATHRGVDFHPLLAHPMRFWLWLNTAMVTKEWVAIHRKHHARCETEDDPHSPRFHGIRKVFFHGVVLYQEACKDRAMIEQYGQGTPDDWIERRLYTPFPALGPTVLVLVLVALFGAVGLAMWALLMLVIPVGAAGFINGLGHWWGYRNFETPDTATNLTPVAFVLGGEELHNNHHAFPSSARFALRKWEFDIGWYAIRAARAVGLARVLREAPVLSVRPNIALPDAETLKAIVGHRVGVMTGYFREVIKPVLRAEFERSRAVTRAPETPLRKGTLRQALLDDGRWLDGSARERLKQWLADRPQVALVVEHRRRLQAAMERSGRSAEATLAGIQQWCAEAEASGISALEAFAARLRGYQLVAVPPR